jgi:hypothetical protein
MIFILIVLKDNKIIFIYRRIPHWKQQSIFNYKVNLSENNFKLNHIFSILLEFKLFSINWIT